MDSTTLITIMICACLGILALIIFSGPIKTAARILFGAIMGMAGIYAVNMLFPSIHIGINPITALVTGVLGVPGFIVLVFAGIVL